MDEIFEKWDEFIKNKMVDQSHETFNVDGSKENIRNVSKTLRIPVVFRKISDKTFQILARNTSELKQLFKAFQKLNMSTTNIVPIKSDKEKDAINWLERNSTHVVNT